MDASIVMALLKTYGPWALGWPIAAYLFVVWRKDTAKRDELHREDLKGLGDVVSKNGEALGKIREILAVVLERLRS